MKVKKCVITAAGTGTRLLPLTKANSKEMMPVCAKGRDGMVLKPVLQVIYESAYDSGIRDFCFVVGKKSQVIRDHFTPDPLQSRETESLDKKISNSSIGHVRQPHPQGFGSATSRSRSFVGNDDFILHAGDDIVLSPGNGHLQRLEEAFYKHNADAAFLVTETEDVRLYGAVEGTVIGKGVIRVENMEEKPEKPRSNMAVIAIYIFKSSIFPILKRTKPDKKGEIQLTDAIKSLIDKGSVICVKLEKGEKRIDIGTPESYVKSIDMSYRSSADT